MKSFSNIWWFATLLALCVGCAGEFDMAASDDEPGSKGVTFDENGKPVHPDDPAAERETEVVPLAPGFDIEKTDVRLLPFHTRMQNLARVTGLSADDPLFDAIYARRYDLGDHNYGQGIGPDLNWNASKMAIWVEALRPVCSSEAMAQRYPELPADLDALLTAAYGRETTADDRAPFDEVVNEVALSDADRYEAVCLSVLTSSEFVAL